MKVKTITRISLMMMMIYLISSNGQKGPDSGTGGGDDNVPSAAGNSTLCDIDGGDSTYIESIVANSSAHFGYIRRIQASGCPNHNSKCQKDEVCTDDETEAIFLNKDYLIPAYPCIADATYDVTCIDSDVGITLNGVSVFSQYGNVQCDDAIINEGETFDACSGHASPTGNYHYHVAPSCLLDQLNDSSTPSINGHSPQIGWAFDGFPIYGPHGNDGEYIYLCTHTNASASDCLDICNGHDQHEIDGFLYHYHITGPIGDLTTEPLSPLPDTDMNPYTIGCLRGVPFDWNVLASLPSSTTACTSANGTTDDYIPMAVAGVTTQYGTPSPTLYEALHHQHYMRHSISNHSCHGINHRSTW